MTFERDTRECPICEGTLREARNTENEWNCDDCARKFSTEELENDF